MESSQAGNSYRDSQVKGRVVTTMESVLLQQGYTMPRPGWLVKQVIDGVVTFTRSYSTNLEAAEDYAMLRAHGRRNLHEYLSSIDTDILGSDYRPRNETDIWQQIYDPQAAALYTAQQQIFYPGMGLEDAIAMPPDFHTEAEARAFARKVQRSALVKKLYPKFAAFRDLTIVFADLPRWTSAQTNNAYPFEILVGSTGWSRQKRTLLHELAHVVDNVEYNHRTSKDGHGPVFAGIYLKLLKEFVGDTAADALAAQFKLSHVRAV